MPVELREKVEQQEITAFDHDAKIAEIWEMISHLVQVHTASQVEMRQLSEEINLPMEQPCPQDEHLG